MHRKKYDMNDGLKNDRQNWPFCFQQSEKYLVKAARNVPQNAYEPKKFYKRLHIKKN